MSVTPMPPKGPSPSYQPPEKEQVTNAQVIRILGFLVVLGTVGIPLTILAWKVALGWTP